jgi:hypothetical protein
MINTAAAQALIRGLADEYTGRDPLALQEINPGQWAEEILAALENREPEEPAQ